MFTRPVSTFSLRSFMHRVWFAPRHAAESDAWHKKRERRVCEASLGTHTLNR